MNDQTDRREFASLGAVQVERTERTDRSSRLPDRPADPVYGDEEAF